MHELFEEHVTNQYRKTTRNSRKSTSHQPSGHYIEYVDHVPQKLALESTFISSSPTPEAIIRSKKAVNIKFCGPHCCTTPPTLGSLDEHAEIRKYPFYHRYLHRRGGSAGIRILYTYGTSSGDIRYDNRSYAVLVQR